MEYMIAKAMALPTAKATVVFADIRHAAVERSVLAIFENITHSTNCVDQRAHRFESTLLRNR